jgi:DNA-binding MarR family transcriptional regulator/GNAT superfamily N-acetyltransferase
MIPKQDIALVRSFNRLVARQVGALNDRYLGRRPLGEARVLFEIGPDGATPRDVRARLGLDSGYLSRMIHSLQNGGLVEETPNPADRRTKRLRLTAAGRSEMRELDRLADGLAASALAPLTDDERARLLRAQSEVRHLLAISMLTIGPEDPATSDARWCLAHYFAELGERFEERFDPQRTLPADGNDLVPPSGAFLLARFGGQPAGCGALKTLAPGTGEIVRMWVDRAHRGLGLGTRILHALEERAAAMGHRRVRLYTNRSLAEAKAMYRDNGYMEIARYNDDPYADHWFEKELAAPAPRGASTPRPPAAPSPRAK